MSKMMPSALVMTGRKRSHSPISRKSRAKSEKSVDRSVMKMTGCPFFDAQVVVDARTLPLPMPVSSPNMNPRPELTRRIINATDRKSVGEGKSVAVRVDLGGRRRIKKTKRKETNRRREIIHKK